MAVSTQFAQGFLILRNDGGRQFTILSPSLLSELTGQIEFADVDQNGTLDLVISVGLARWVDVSLNTGSGNFIFPIAMGAAHFDFSGAAGLGVAVVSARVLTWVSEFDKAGSSSDEKPVK